MLSWQQVQQLCFTPSILEKRHFLYGKCTEVACLQNVLALSGFSLFEYGL